MIRRLIYRVTCKPRGQSFVELMLILVILALLLAGVVEYGFLMNNYLHVLDGAREAARFSSSDNPFHISDTGQIYDWYRPSFYYLSAAKAATTMTPVELDPTHPDDIVISVFSVATGHLPVRFPSTDPNGWSLCAHYAAFAAYFPSLTPPAPVPPGLDASGWSSGCTVRTTQLSSTDIQNRFAGLSPIPPPGGVLVVEIYYNYPQTLKLPIFSNSEFLGVKFSIIPDPIPLYVYTVMPIAAAEPTKAP